MRSLRGYPVPVSGRGGSFPAGCPHRLGIVTVYAPIRNATGNPVCAGVPAYSQILLAPCGARSQLSYDLIPLAKPRFDHRMMASSGPHSGDLTGGVCKEQGRIRRALVTRDYYRIQLHEGEFQPSIRTATAFRGLASPFGVASHCHGHCSPRVAQHIRGILTYRCPFLPPLWQRQSS